MTIAQAKNFYEQDTKDYEIEKNKDFLYWLRNLIENGYRCFLETAELQELIDNIVKWYEIKYPEREFEYFEGTKHMDFQDIRRISDKMDMKQLLFRLPHNQLCLMKCGYRAKGWGQHPIYKQENKVEWKPQICMRINRKKGEEWETPYFLLYADHMTGEVAKNYELEEYLDKKKINLDELLLIFNEKYREKLDFTELKESVYNHNCDRELRNRILQLVALKLLYSKNTTPERGYKRAKRFIKEFNKRLGLTLSTEQIDEIIQRDYNNEKKEKDDLKEVVKTKEQSKGIKKLVRKFQKTDNK